MVLIVILLWKDRRREKDNILKKQTYSRNEETAIELIRQDLKQRSLSLLVCTLRGFCAQLSASQGHLLTSEAES